MANNGTTIQYWEIQTHIDTMYVCVVCDWIRFAWSHINRRSNWDKMCTHKSNTHMLKSTQWKQYSTVQYTHIYLHIRKERDRDIESMLACANRVYALCSSQFSLADFNGIRTNITWTIYTFKCRKTRGKKLISLSAWAYRAIAQRLNFAIDSISIDHVICTMEHLPISIVDV